MSPPTGDIGPGELARLMQTLAKSVDELRAEIKGLSTMYTPREVHDLALGGVKIDIRRIDEQHAKDSEALKATAGALDDRLDEQERDAARKFRQLMLSIFGGIVAPLTVALVIYVLTTLSKAAPA